MNIIYSFIDSAFSLAAKIKTFCKPLLSASYLKATSRNYFYNKSIKMHLVVIRNQRISRYDTFSEFSNMQFAIQLEVKFEDVDCEIFRLNIPNKTRLRNFLFAVCFRLNRLRFAQLYFRTWSLFFFFCSTLLTKHGRIRSRTQVVSLWFYLPIYVIYHKNSIFVWASF